MEIIASRDSLSNILQKLQTVLEKGSSLNNTENILLQTKDECLEIIAYDQNCSARGITKVKVIKAGSISINGRKAFDLVRSLSDNNITIRLQDSQNMILIEDSKSSFKILGADIEEFPEIDFSVPDQAIHINSTVFNQLIELTIFAVAKKADPRYNLQGVYLKIDPVNGLGDEDLLREKEISVGSHYFSLVSTDGHRVSVARTDQFSGLLKFGDNRIFSRKSLLEIKNIFSNHEDLKMAFSGNEAIVWGGEFILILRMLEGKFPDYRKMIPNKFRYQLRLQRNVLLGTLKQMNLLAQEQYKGVILQIEDGNMKVSIDNPEMGYGHTDVPIDYHGENIRIGFNIRYLMDFLQALPDEDVFLLVNNGTQPCLLQGTEHEDYMCGIMPIC